MHKAAQRKKTSTNQNESAQDFFSHRPHNKATMFGFWDALIIGIVAPYVFSSKRASSDKDCVEIPHASQAREQSANSDVDKEEQKFDKQFERVINGRARQCFLQMKNAAENGHTDTVCDICLPAYFVEMLRHKKYTAEELSRIVKDDKGSPRECRYTHVAWHQKEEN